MLIFSHNTVADNNVANKNFLHLVRFIMVFQVIKHHLLISEHDTVFADGNDNDDKEDGGKGGEADDSQYLVSLILVYWSSSLPSPIAKHYFPHFYYFF